MLKSTITQDLSDGAKADLFDRSTVLARGTRDHPVAERAEFADEEVTDEVSSDHGDLDPIGETEDLERAIYGVPHQVVGFTALYSFVFAVALVLLFISGAVGQVVAVVLAVVGVPLLVMSLSNRSARTRDHRHPSR